MIKEKRDEDIRWREEVKRKLQESEMKHQQRRTKGEEDFLLKTEYQRLKRLDREEAAQRL